MIPKRHKHRCDCGHIWEHVRLGDGVTSEEYNKAHDCPKCGHNVRQVYYDDYDKELMKAGFRTALEAIADGDLDTDTLNALRAAKALASARNGASDVR